MLLFANDRIALWTGQQLHTKHIPEHCYTTTKLNSHNYIFMTSSNVASHLLL